MDIRRKCFTIEQLGFEHTVVPPLLPSCLRGTTPLNHKSQAGPKMRFKIEFYAIGPSSTIVTLDGIQNLDLIGDNNQSFAIVEEGTQVEHLDLYLNTGRKPIGTFVGMADIVVWI